MKKNLFLTLVILSALGNSTILNSQPITINLLWEKIANVGSMEFSPNGQFLITGGATNVCYPTTCGQIKIWRVADSSLIRTITNFKLGYVNDISIANDNQKFITANGSIYCYPQGGCSFDRPGQFMYNFPEGTFLDSLLNPGGVVLSIDYSPDNTLIATGTQQSITGEIRIYDSQFNLIRILPGHEQETSSLKFTPDGQKLVSGGHDGKVRIWNVADGSLIRTLDHGTYTNGGWDVQVDISPDGQLIASAGQGYNMTIKIFRLSDGQLLHTLPAGPEIDGYNSIQFSPNGVYLASGITTYGLGGLGWYGLLRFRRVSDGALVQEYIDTIGSPTGGGVRTIAFSPSGNNFFAYSIFNRLRLATTNLDLVVIPGTKTLELSTCIEGFYNPSLNRMMKDTVSVYLRSINSPYNIVDFSKGILDSMGRGNFQFQNAVSGTPYYIVVKHRNSIETWSSSGVSFSSNSLSYDFTTLSSQAYGNNLVLLGSKYCVYSADVDQNGIVDASDLSMIDNDAYNSVSGYAVTDVNGDDFVDAADLSIADNNAFNDVILIRP